MATYPVMNGEVAALEARRIADSQQQQPLQRQLPPEEPPQQSSESELNDRNKSAHYVGETQSTLEIARRLGWTE